MREPLRQTGFVTATVLILSSLLALLVTLAAREAFGEPPTYDEVPYHTAVRTQPQDCSRWPNFGALLDSRQRPQPHPAVARIIVPEGPATAYGTGTLIDVRGGYGLVVTNWHVVREATGVIEVVFPNGFRSQARALKVDPDWDLAALVIWQPTIEPVTLAQSAPRPGDALTIHGYGQGEYRVASGRCTQYYAPRADFPQEMVELNVEARQGDSGGPIFNERGELAGVLFGAGQGTTIGSFGGRVESFLATLAPDIGRSRIASLASASGTARELTSSDHCRPDCQPCDQYGPLVDAHQSQPLVAPRLGAFGSSEPPRVGNSGWPNSTLADSGVDPTTSAEQSPWHDATDTASIAAEESPTAPTPLNRSNLLEQAKSLFAIIGLIAVCIQIVRVVT